MTDILNRVNSPEDLKKLSYKETLEYCDAAREFLVENIEKTGGHLASNLGVTELTVAIHKVFDSPKDHIIFDVGHQSYVHKMITGRKDGFENLRKPGGMSGFTLMRESRHDAFGAGHSSTSVSAALGYAEADRLNNNDSYSIAVLGDGAFTGGMVHEALNNCDPDLKLIIILNENGMSISVNKGRFASYLSRVRISKGYNSLKSGTKTFLTHIPLLGKPIQALLYFIKRKFKSLFFSPNYFEDLGLYYMGPIDGNNYKKVENALEEAKRMGKCVILHVKTVKGKGYAPAEKSPDGFHSVNSASKASDSFHSVFSDELIRHAENDKKILAVTAAMGMGTGLDRFEEKYPDRYFDVGIAEEHALTFSAGLAAAGMKPYADIYSTFLQRGYDSIIHDICLQNLPVRIIIDRAGLAKSDGATHHGIFDTAFLSHIPNIKIYSPATYSSLKRVLQKSLNTDSPIAIRYPNSAEASFVDSDFKDYTDFGIRVDFDTDNTPDYIFVTYGTLVCRVSEAENIISKSGHSAGIILLEELKPLKKTAEAVLSLVQKSKRVVFAEEGIKNGGIAMLLESELTLLDSAVADKFLISAIEDNFASPAEPCELYDSVGLSPEKLADKMLSGNL